MKKLILLVTVLFSTIIALAQNADPFFHTSKDSLKIVCDGLASMAKTKYTFISFSENLKRAGGVITYRDTNNEDNRLSIFFSVYSEGANEALEIPGTPVYSFYSVRGNFLDVFPFWKKYIDPNADAEKTSNSNMTKVYLKSTRTYKPEALLYKNGANDFEIIIR